MMEGERGVSLREHWAGLTCDTILMFSGGRDSTLAAARMHESGQRFAMVTVTSSHLRGIGNVLSRLDELNDVLGLKPPWVNIQQPVDLKTDTSFYHRTCLPCHHAYVVVAVALAKILSARNLAFGYVRYQNDWPEQTELATKTLASALTSMGIDLQLPVYEVSSRADAIEELSARGLSPDSLEQKCLQQVSNVALSKESLDKQIALWSGAIKSSLEKLDQIDFTVISTRSD